MRVKCLDPAPNAPASVAAEHVVGDFRNREHILRFAKYVILRLCRIGQSEGCGRSCDVLTVEIEHVDVDALRDVSREIGIPVQPSPDTIEIIQACPFFTLSDILFCFSQDKCRQKTHFQANGIPVIDFCDIPDVETLQHICDERLPVMLKAKR